MKSHISLSICIVCYNTQPHQLLTLIDSLSVAAQHLKEKFTFSTIPIYVVDNSASDKNLCRVIDGKKDSMKYMKNIFHDWQAKGITSVLHEKRGGYANNTASIYGLANKAESLGVRIITGTEVTGFKRGSNSKAVTGVETNKGTIDCEQVVIGAGPWARDFWNMLELPKTAKIKDKDGKMHTTDMWTYWMLQEGVIGVEPDFLKMNNGEQPPVIHVDSTAPLYSDKTKKLITDKIWGIYYKPDIEGLGVQGGTSPYIVKKHFDEVNVDPYGIESPEYQTTEAFNDMWCSCLLYTSDAADE